LREKQMAFDLKGSAAGDSAMLIKEGILDGI
jgi:hypothetical protein